MTKRTEHRSRAAFIHAIFALAILAMTGACSTPVWRASNEAEPALSADRVLTESPLEGNGPTEFGFDIDLLEVSPAMEAFLDENVDRGSSHSQRLAQLVTAVITEDRFVLAYDDSTRTAQDTFNARRGNCISFTNMFVAMARDIGLNASYQEVTIPPDWSMTGETYLFSQHVNVLVELKSALARVVDFNTYRFALPDESRVISDSRARAHYFNNIGVEKMLADDSAGAYAYFREAIREDREFGPAWINLGILHHREGLGDFAEAAYLEALRYDRANLIAMSNLASLYEEQGETELSASYAEQVRAHRMSNPYYRYQLANSAFAEGDYRASIKHLKYAVRQRQDEDRFYYLLSLSYLMAGEKEDAKRWMQKAEEAAREARDRQRYHHKLDLLMRQGTGI